VINEGGSVTIEAGIVINDGGSVTNDGGSVTNEAGIVMVETFVGPLPGWQEMGRQPGAPEESR